jgi:hypothetical protein
MPLATGDATASQNLIDIKDRLKWNGAAELEVDLFDWRKNDAGIRPMNTHPNSERVGTAQARIIVLNITGRLYSARGMERRHSKLKLGYKVPHSKELVYFTEKIVEAFCQKGHDPDPSDLKIDPDSAHQKLKELDGPHKNQRRLAFGKNKTKAKAS